MLHNQADMLGILGVAAAEPKGSLLLWDATLVQKAPFGTAENRLIQSFGSCLILPKGTHKGLGVVIQHYIANIKNINQSITYVLPLPGITGILGIPFHYIMETAYVHDSNQHSIDLRGGDRFFALQHGAKLMDDFL